MIFLLLKSILAKYSRILTFPFVKQDKFVQDLGNLWVSWHLRNGHGLSQNPCSRCHYALRDVNGFHRIQVSQFQVDFNGCNGFRRISPFSERRIRRSVRPPWWPLPSRRRRFPADAGWTRSCGASPPTSRSTLFIKWRHNQSSSLSYQNKAHLSPKNGIGSKSKSHFKPFNAKVFRCSCCRTAESFEWISGANWNWTLDTSVMRQLCRPFGPTPRPN